MLTSYRFDPPDPRDRPFSSGLFVPRASSQGDVDMRAHCTDSQQGGLGSCAGNATADSIEILDSIEGKPKVELSRLFVYAMARHLQDEDMDGANDLNLDKGTYLRLCMDVLSRFGICRETSWPYDQTKVYVVPSLKALREAAGHRIHSYYRINATGDMRLDEVLSALRSGHPVVFGTLVNQAFTTLSGEGPVSPPTGATMGGHAMIVVGYISGKGFLIKNSWGRGWGDNGFCIMRPEYLTWGETTDLWVPTLGTSFT